MPNSAGPDHFPGDGKPVVAEVGTCAFALVGMGLLVMLEEACSLGMIIFTINEISTNPTPIAQQTRMIFLFL